MKAVKTTDIKFRTKEVLDEAAGGEIIIVSRPRNQNVVVLSEVAYNLMRKAAEVGQPVIDKEQRKRQRKAELLVIDG